MKFRKGRSSFGLALTSLLVLTLYGCGTGDHTANDSAATSASAPVASDSAKTETGDGAAEAAAKSSQIHSAAIGIKFRQVIRKADLSVRVANVEKSEKSLNKIVASVGGYVDSASSSDLASNHPQLTIVVRVPVGAFDPTIEKFEALGVRKSKSINSEDVTGQLVDLDARLKTLQAQEEVYRGMLKTHAKLGDLLELQQRLGQVRAEIEEIAGQRKSKGELAALSTISVTLEQDAVVSHPDSDPNWMNQSWAEATTGAAGTMRTIVGAIMWLAAYSILWLPILVVISLIAWRLIRKRPTVGTPGGM